MDRWDEQPPADSGARWLRGVWASVPTPFNDEGDLDLTALAANTAHYADALRLEGIYCNGIMGEGWSLTVDERAKVAAATVAAGGSRLKVGVVITAGSPRETIYLARHAEEAGAHHLVISPPPGNYTVSEILRYVRMVRDYVDLPLVVVEASSGGFGMDVLQVLASHPGLISAVKIGSNRQDVAQLFDRLGSELIITDPYEANWLSNLKAFGMDVLYADPEPYLFQSATRRPIESYYKAFMDGEVEKANAIHDDLEPARALYDRMIMEPLRHGVAAIGALKAWCEYVGLAVGPPRMPLSPLDGDTRRELYRKLDAIGLRAD